MRVEQHQSYEEYLSIQRSLTSRKTNRGRTVLIWAGEEYLRDVNKVMHLYVSEIKSIVCHGCRSGFEVDILQKLNPDARVFGTDLYGKAYKYDRINFREMDFDIVPKEWEMAFDVVYSNSIDHSRNPVKTLLAWKSELRNGGVIFVTFQFTDRPMTKADCFSLSVAEYESEIRQIADEIGMGIKHFSSVGKYGRGGHYVDIVFLKDQS